MQEGALQLQHIAYQSGPGADQVHELGVLLDGGQAGQAGPGEGQQPMMMMIMRRKNKFYDELLFESMTFIKMAKKNSSDKLNFLCNQVDANVFFLVF